MGTNTHTSNERGTWLTPQMREGHDTSSRKRIMFSSLFSLLFWCCEAASGMRQHNAGSGSRQERKKRSDLLLCFLSNWAKELIPMETIIWFSCELNGHVGKKSLQLVDNPARCCRISNYLFTWIPISISCLGSEKRSASSSLCVSLYGGIMGMGRRWKETTVAGGALAREEAKWRHSWVVRRVIKVEMAFL
jgi:hypothetical protein